MSYLILKRSFRRLISSSSSIHFQNPSFKSQCHHFCSSHLKNTIQASGYHSFWKRCRGSVLFSANYLKISSFGPSERFFGSGAAVELSSSDGLTVEGIIAKQWPIVEESVSDWKSHASSIAQSIHLIKKRLKVIVSFLCLQ